MALPDEQASWLAALFGGRLRRQVAKAVLERWCVQGERPLTDLFTLSSDALNEGLGIDPAQAAMLLAVAQDVPVWAERLAHMASAGIQLVLRTDPAYPETLAQRLPEVQLPYVLFALGDLALLSEPALSIQGSDCPSVEASATAEALACSLAQLGQPLIGGYDSGIDRLALDAARRASGVTILALAQGLHALPALAAMEAETAAGRLLALSPYLPEQGYAAALAQARRPLVTAMAEALFLFEPQTAPQDWPGYVDSHARGLPALIWSGAGATVDEWLAAGALPFADAAAACRAQAEVFGLDAAQQPFNSLREAGSDTPVYVSPHYANAEEALEALRRAGSVPPALARRLRQADWSDTP